VLLSELLKFNKENYFNGAVQADWFYDNGKVKAVSESYVFHGPKYFGVSTDDVTVGRHRLLDTASFVKRISEKIYGDDKDNLLLTIAGYGTGKSHLAVTLASLFSGHNNLLRTAVIERISSADRTIGDELSATVKNCNLVLVLNGMNNFNLDYEVLKCAQKALELHGHNIDALKDATKAYRTARHFVEQTYFILKDKFIQQLDRNKIAYSLDTLQEFLIESIDHNSKVFEAINEVYKEINGSYIRWDEGVSAGDILTKLNNILCVQEKKFNKILVLFDEFGRYIEFSAANPTIAGESALQQIFEAVQNSNGNIVFVGFIQSDLNAYLSRIDKTANIIRYVGRYEASEKFYLSSNFETILANLIQKTDNARFEGLIGSALDNPYRNYHSKIYGALQRWAKNTKTKSVWSNKNLYDNVVLRGCYPLHPITVWILTNMSGWLQQRSTITFAEGMFSEICNKEVVPGKLEYIYPVDIIDSEIFYEMVNAEEKGVQQSQYCLLYRDIFVKYGDKLSDDEKRVLKAILITNIGKFEFYDKNDAATAILYCSGMSIGNIEKILKQLENLYGIIQYDENSKKYDLIAEGNGFNEFKREFIKKMLLVRNFNGISDYDSVITEALDLNTPIDTQFGFENKINSTEWRFAKKLISITDFDEAYANQLIGTLDKATDGETPRGMLVYLYCDNETYAYTVRVSTIIRSKKLNEYPVLILLINDNDGEIVENLKRREALKLFPTSERQRFERFVNDQERRLVKKITQTFNTLSAERYVVTQDGVVKKEQRLAVLCNELFKTIYNKTVPFMFDGFQKKPTASIKRYLIDICQRLYDNTLTNIQSYQSLAPDIKNRVKAVLSTQMQNSWMVFDSNCALCEPQNPHLQVIYSEVMAELESGSKRGFALFKRYLYPPYGMNMYSLTLFIIYLISYNSRIIYTYLGVTRIRSSQFSQEIFKDTKIQFDTILRMGFQMVQDTGQNPIFELCNKILSNVYVENCQQYKAQLDNMLYEMDLTSEVEGKLSSAKMKLQDGERLYSQIYGNIRQAEEILSESKVNFQLHKFVRIYPLVQSYNGKIDKYSDYIYSSEYADKCKALIQNADEFLNKCASDSIQKLSCNITQLTQFKAVYKKAAEILAEIGKQELADKVSSRLAEIEQELKAKQKYEQTFAHCDREIAFCNNTSEMSYKVCCDNLAKMKNWETYITELKDISERTKQEIVNKIRRAKENLNARMDKINRTIESLRDSFKAVSCDSELALLQLKINHVISFDVPIDIQQEMSSYTEMIEKYNAIFAESNLSPDTLVNLKRRVEEELSGSALYSLANSTIKKLEATLSAQEEIWIQKYIITAEKNLDNMEPQDCIDWKRATNNLPDYLSIKAKQNYQRTSTLIEKRLKDCRIQGVIMLFNELSESEKRECFLLLQREIN